jgi:hypothetical protein
MDKTHTAYKNNEEQRKQNPHRKDDNIQKKNQNTKKSKVPLIPAQRLNTIVIYNKIHYKKISCLDMVEQTAKN